MNSAGVIALSPELVREYHRVDHGRHHRRLAAFVMFYLVGAVAACLIHRQWGHGWLTWILAAPFYLLAAVSLHGVSLFTHEAVHGTLSSRRWLNWSLGAACAIPVLQNCAAYRVLHLRHHNHLGDEQDPDHYANYTRWTWMIFWMNWLRLILGYPVYIVMIPILGFKHGKVMDRWLIVSEVAATLVVVAVAIGLSLPWWVWLHGWLIPMGIINTLVNIRGMSQHTLLDHSSDEIRGTRTILTAGVVKYFMCNENYHLEHHLYPAAPWYRLPQIHAALGSQLAAMGAPYIPSYNFFVRQFIRHSLHRSPLGWKRRDASSVPSS